MLIRCKVMKPFAFMGRIVCTYERLNLHPTDFEALEKSGHVARIEIELPINGQAIDVGPWARPVTRRNE